MELFLNTNDLALASQDVDSLKNGLINYQNIFKNATALYKVKGFKDAGLEGSMRTAVHQLEHASFLPDLKPLLSLRRHEKDFILRKDLSYVHKYDKEWQQLMDSYSSLIRLNAIQKDSLIQALSSYRSSFQKIVLIEQRIGLTENVGLRSQIAHNQYRLEVKLLSIQSEIAQQTEASIRTLKAVIWIISSFLLFFLILLTALFAVFNDHVRKPVLKLKEAANQVSQGRLSIDISDLKKYTMLEELTTSIEQIIQKFKETITVVDNIATGKQQQSLKILDGKDEIGKALLSIFDRFNEIKIQEEKRAWHNEGLAKFAEIAREHHSIKTFSEKAVAHMVQYLGINQAGLFVLANDEQSIQMTAMYAYDRKKFADKHIHLKEGLVGQCFVEKESIFITEVPNNYTHITSGLGHATPRCVYLLACQTKDRVEAVLELASFHVLEEHHRAFLEKIGESIAATIYFIRINEKAVYR